MASVAPEHGRVVRNWADTYSASPSEYWEPASVEDVVAIVRRCRAAGRVLRAVGNAHSPNDCAMTNDVMLSLRRLNRVLVIDSVAGVAKVEAGISLSDLTEALDRNGLALHNLGSISEQSVAGAIGTSTHGTGLSIGCTATEVLELQLVDAAGEIRIASRATSPDLFAAALCSFGCLGIVTGVVLRVVPAYDLLAVESEAPLAEVMDNFRARAASAKYYRFWWFPHTDMTMEWRADPVRPGAFRSDPAAAALDVAARAAAVASVATAEPPEGSVGGHAGEPRYRGAVASSVTAAPSLGGILPADAPAWRPPCTSRLLRPAWEWFWGMFVGFHLLQAALALALVFPGLVPLINAAWRRVMFSSTKRRVDRSDRCFNFNCLFRQHVDEWAVGIDEFPRAMRALQDLIRSTGQKAHFPIEVRFVAGDDIWLSPAYGRDSVYIGIIAYKPYGLESEHRQYFRRYEEALLALGGRPHWGKDFHCRGDAHFAPIYPRWHAFKALRDSVDPARLFVNEFVRRTLGLATTGPERGDSSSSNVAAASAPAAMGNEDAAHSLLLRPSSSRFLAGAASGIVPPSCSFAAV